MDELIDILDAQGQPTAQTAMKSEAHLHGWFHATIHVWCYTSEGTILLQQRAPTKTTFPLLWDVSVAGHIGSGENIVIAALREMEEEIGYTARTKDLEKLGVFKSMQTHGETLIDNEFHHTFLCELKVPIEQLSKQESEVASLQLVPFHELKQMLNNTKKSKKMVPHAPAYYQAVFSAIEDRLTAF